MFPLRSGDRPFVHALKLRRRFLALCLTLVIAVASEATTPTYALETGDIAVTNASIKVLNGCPLGSDCSLLAFLVDPPAQGVTSLSMALTYDPGNWIFRTDLSGPLCDFAVGGSCPAASAQIGTFRISDTVPVPVTPGAPLPGSTLTVTNDTVAGIASLQYTLGSPLNITGEPDQNFFAFVFQSMTPFDPSKLNVTYHNQPGSYQFTQKSFNCTNADIRISCASNTPVTGVSLSAVPEPSTWALMIAGIGIVGGSLRVVAKQRRSRLLYR